MFADGDYVIVHVHAVREPGTRGSAIVDILMLENGPLNLPQKLVASVSRRSNGGYSDTRLANPAGWGSRRTGP
jgi:hypothetical protein